MPIRPEKDLIALNKTCLLSDNQGSLIILLIKSNSENILQILKK